MVPTAPCKDCKDREFGCHDRCPEYQQFRRKNCSITFRWPKFTMIMFISRRKQKNMQTINENIKSNNCNFEFCRNYEDGKCLNAEDRKNCLEIAMAVLCINEDESDS